MVNGSYRGQGRYRATRGNIVEGIVVNADMEFFRKNLLSWFEKNKRDFPWRHRDTSHYQLLIGEIMLQKTRAENVVNIYQNFLKKYPNPYSIRNARPSEIQNFIKPLGLCKRRTKTLINLGKYACKKGVPNTEEDLKEIYGIGQYIINAYLSIARGKKRPIVDTNVKRIYSRFFSFNFGRDPRRDPRIWQFAWDLLPRVNVRSFNLALLDFGALVCKENNPRCSTCPLEIRCKRRQEENVESKKSPT